MNLRKAINSAIKTDLDTDISLEMLGCTVEEYKKYLSQFFTDKMQWDNWGKVWHIDHIKPIASFKFTNRSELKTCFHYTNTQPLLVAANLNKGSRHCGVKYRKGESN